MLNEFFNNESVHLMIVSTAMIGISFAVLFIIEKIFGNKIFKRERLTRELAISQYKYKVLYETSADAIMTLSPPNWNFTSGNAAAIKMFAAKNEAEFISKHPGELSPKYQPDGRTSPDKAKEMIEIAMNSGSNYFDWEHKRINGSTFPATVLLTRVDIEGEHFLQATVRDESKRVANEEKLQVLSKAVEQSPISIMILNKYGYIEYVNQQFYDATNYPPSYVIGKSPDFMVLKGLNEFHKYKKNVLKGEIWKGKLCSQKYNGEKFWELVSISGIFNQVNELGYYVWVSEDITSETELQQNLIQAKERAEEASKSKNQFLANMSHELRTPLNAIIGYSDLLMSGFEKETRHDNYKYSTYINDSGKHLLSLINDVLDLSKIEADAFELLFSAVDLGSIIENAVLLIKWRTDQDDITLVVDIADDVGDAWGDARVIKQVLYNLLSNAQKFTPSGGQIFVRAMRKENEYLICISDTGIGIETEDQACIFKMFKKVNQQKDNFQPGAGIGLALTKRLIIMQKGKIWVESEGRGKGSKFSFTIPVAN